MRDFIFFGDFRIALSIIELDLPVKAPESPEKGRYVCIEGLSPWRQRLILWVAGER